MDKSKDVVAAINALTAKMASFDERMASFEERFDDRLGRLERKVSAIEAVPVPGFPRPHTYHRATEIQSVTKPVRRRTGYSG